MTSFEFIGCNVLSYSTISRTSSLVIHSHVPSLLRNKEPHNSLNLIRGSHLDLSQKILQHVVEHVGILHLFPGKHKVKGLKTSCKTRHFSSS